MGVVGRRRSGHGLRHAQTVRQGEVIGEDDRTFVTAPFEGLAVVTDGLGGIDCQRAGAGVDVAEVESVLSVVVEAGVIDVGREAHAWRRSYAVAVASGALAVAGDGGDGVDNGVFLVAAVPRDGGVVEGPEGVGEAGCPVAIVGAGAVIEVPAGHAVEIDFASVAGDRASDCPYDAAVGVAVDPDILEHEVVGVGVGGDAFGVVVIDGVVGAAIAGRCRAAVNDALGVAGDVEALDIDILCAFEVEGVQHAVATEDLSEAGFGGGVSSGTAGVVFTEDAGVLRRGTGGDGRIDAGVVAVAAQAPDIVGACSLIETDPPGAATDDDGVTACDHPGVVAVAAVVPEITVVVEGAMLVSADADVGGIGLAVALALRLIGGEAGTSVGTDVPGGSGAGCGCRGGDDGGGRGLCLSGGSEDEGSKANTIEEKEDCAR